MMVDSYGRVVDYLRISVLENCNFRCVYCMPNTPLEWMPKEDLLSIDELFSFVKVAIDRGVKKIRITGGEPTLREDLSDFLSMIRDYSSSVELTLTSNGFLLSKKAKEYAEAGLKRVNISLDTLDRDMFKIITKRDALEQVIEGIRESIKNGIRVKINMVPLVGFNEDDISKMLRFCMELKVPLRFIEYMENEYAGMHVRGMRAQEILKEITKEFSYERKEQELFGPATLYTLQNGYIFGIIEPHKEDFCKSCNRLRLTSDGRLVPCLYYDESINIKEALKSGDATMIEQKLLEAVASKPEKNMWNHEMQDSDISKRAFYQTGG